MGFRTYAIGVICSGVTVLGGCTPEPQMPTAQDGAMLFAANCAACHGADAKGGGTAAEGLSKQPPDLSQLAARAGGTFPAAQTLSTIDGYAKGNHPGRIMPEFGDVLTGDTVPLDIDGVLTPTPRPLAALYFYLESIQG